ncbi:MAG: hypothetical protein WC601_05770 [Desulfotomaculaceae bacterium]
MYSAVKKNEVRRKLSSAGYVYVEGHGWINIDLYLAKLKKDVKRFEQELGITPKKVKVCLNQEVG